jgi:hypothetical protein
MGKIRIKQLDYLEGGQELINYKVFTPEGDYLNTENEDILFKTKRDLVPLNMDLMKEYERPLKKVSIETDLSNLYYKNQNAHFLYGDEKFVIQPPDSGTAAIQSDANEPVNALSGDKYFKSTELSLETSIGQDGNPLSNTAMITIKREHNSFPQNKPMTIGFNYYIATDDPSDKFKLRMKIGLQETYDANSAYDKEYDFDNEEWIDYNGQTGRMHVTA